MPPNEQEPSVGIFWFVPDSGASRLLHDLTPLTRAEPYGDMLTHDRGHAEFWDYLISLGAARLRAARIPTIPLTAEYEEYPRGRVVFDRRQALFVAYADRRLQLPAFRTSVIDEFGLAGRRVVWKMDSHYARSRHIPPLQRT